MVAKAKRRTWTLRNQRSATKDDVDIGLRIRLRRVELGLSQAELGKRLGISFQQIQKYEKGVNRISGARFVELCRLLQVEPNYLLGWQGKALKGDEVQTNDTVTLRMAQAISLLPSKLRAPVHVLIRSLGELSPADLKE